MVEGLTCFRADIRHIQCYWECLRGASAPLSFSSPYFLFLYLRYNSRRVTFRIRDKTAGIATTHKFLSILIPKRWQTPRTTKVNTIPTATQPDARNIYSLTMVEIIIGYELKQHKSSFPSGDPSPCIPLPLCQGGEGIIFLKGAPPL